MVFVADTPFTVKERTPLLGSANVRVMEPASDVCTRVAAKV